MDMNLIIIIVCVILMILIPILMKKRSWKKLMKYLGSNDFDAFYKELDSFWCTLTFGTFERENMRLSGMLAQNKKFEVEHQIDMMMNMRIKPKQKVVLGQRAFYYYLELGKIKRARDMIDFVKANGPESSYMDLEIQYSILLKKESKYIDEVKARIDHIWNGTDPLVGDKKLVVGTFQYLLGLQYSYLNDEENMRHYFTLALENVKGTPYENSIYKIIGR